MNFDRSFRSCVPGLIKQAQAYGGGIQSKYL